MLELILLVPIGFLGYLLWRADRRYDQLRETFDAERRALLTRIQAPELAPTLDTPEPSMEPLYVSPEVDSEWNDYIEDRRAGIVK